MIKKSDIKDDEDFKDKSYYPFYYKGIRVQQNRNIFDSLDSLSKEIEPSQIIEIGACDGGFTKILEDHKISKNAKIYSIDIDAENSNVNYGDKVETIQGDCFSLEEQIAKRIQQEGISLVFCDGGNKNKEINTFSKYLKSGDFIFGHDYAPSTDFWRENFNGKIWDWHETWDSAIEESIKTYNLKPYLYDEFLKSVWICLRKN